MADEGGLAAASELAAHDSVTPVSLSALFVAFLTVSLFGFGGGLVSKNLRSPEGGSICLLASLRLSPRRR
jgi:hypothetical protein